MPRDAALVTALILDRPMCLSCITTKATMGAEAVETTLERIKAALVLHRTTDRCRACGETREVLFVDRPTG